MDGSNPRVTLPSASASILMGGGSIVASGAIPQTQATDAHAMQQDLVFVGQDLWGAINHYAPQQSAQQRLFDPEQR